MRTINQLPEEVISKIAAGEVVERPAYALKELIENSLDAGASNIDIEIEDAGLGKIAVYDNGIGMSREDILVCFKPHTTSKISTERDLVGVKSLGFRGEALSSISAIADVVIKSKRGEDTEGSLVHLSGGKVGKIQSVGMPQGTQVIIKNLFSSVPARKKFLKTTKTENRHILDMVTNFAVSSPAVAIKFSRDGKEIFHFNYSDGLDARLNYIFGQNVFDNLIPFQSHDSYIKMSGVLSRPQIATATSQKVYLFVNGRRVYDPLAVTAIKEAYSNLLENYSYPFCIIFLNIPHEFVDVNVHPRKEIVKFVDPNMVYSFINNKVHEVLDSANLTFFNLSWKNSATSSPAAKLLKEMVLPSDVAQIGKIESSSEILQLHNLYLVTQTQSGVMFIDQHAAHEAILYRHFKEVFEKQIAKRQSVSLEKPLLWSTTLPDSDIVRENIQILNKLGYEIQDFGKGSFKIDSIPQLLEGSDIITSLNELIDDLREGKRHSQIDKKTNKMLSYLACRSAIKQGQRLTDKDMKKLLSELKKEDYIYTCPHGRPVKIEISLRHLHTMFRRR